MAPCFYGQLGQQCIIENPTGAGDNIAAEMGARARRRLGIRTVGKFRAWIFPCFT
jgi:hypothetical protein